MDENRFPVVTRSLTSIPSRRDVLRGLVAAGLGLGVSQASGLTEAKKRRKQKKANPNSYGCRSVGVACQTAGQCCSNICAGKKGKRRCRGHGAGTCMPQLPGVCTPDNPSLSLCNSEECLCFRTTAGSIFCGELFDTNLSQCVDCSKDADCLALGFPRGTACVPMTGELCASTCEIGTACMLPCGAVLPDPPED